MSLNLFRLKFSKSSLLTGAKKGVKYLVLICLIVLPIELISYLYLKFVEPDALKIIEIVKNDTAIADYQRCIPLSYLNYIPSPGYSADGYVQHNAQGYRGKLVTQEKIIPNTYRIVFMGGSTTYGWGVANPDDTYPAETGKQLRKLFPEKKIEVINAGIPWGTSAEILTQYLLKFRYYRPDLVVINTGGNDAQALLYDNYQPDYSHWRRNIPSIPQVSGLAKILLHSNFVTMISYHLFFSNINFVHNGSSLLAPWYSHDAAYAMKNIDEYAFYRNIKTTVQEIVADSTEVVLLSFKGNPAYDTIVPEAKYFNFNENVLKQIAAETHTWFLAFPVGQITDKCWMDNCHLNEEGEKIKAAYVSNFIASKILNY